MYETKDTYKVYYKIKLNTWDWNVGQMCVVVSQFSDWVYSFKVMVQY